MTLQQLSDPTRKLYTSSESSHIHDQQVSHEEPEHIQHAQGKTRNRKSIFAHFIPQHTAEDTRISDIITQGRADKDLHFGVRHSEYQGYLLGKSGDISDVGTKYRSSCVYDFSDPGDTQGKVAEPIRMDEQFGKYQGYLGNRDTQGEHVGQYHDKYQGELQCSTVIYRGQGLKDNEVKSDSDDGKSTHHSDSDYNLFTDDERDD